MTNTSTNRSKNAASDPSRTLIGIFDDRLEAERAVSDLEASGFTHQQIGFVIRGSDVTQGGMITDAIGAKDGRGALAGAVTGGLAGGMLAAAVTALMPGVGPVLAAGTLAMFLGYAGGGATVGGILGALTGLEISEDEARYYETHFHEGKAIVAVQAGPFMARAREILERHDAHNLRNVRHSPIAIGGVFGQP